MNKTLQFVGALFWLAIFIGGPMLPFRSCMKKAEEKIGKYYDPRNDEISKQVSQGIDGEGDEVSTRVEAEHFFRRSGKDYQRNINGDKVFTRIEKEKLERIMLK